MLWNSINELAQHLKKINFKNKGGKIYLTSGGFDPLHVGHLRCIQETVKLASQADMSLVVIIVNGDGFLHRKKGYAFMPCKERMEIIDGIAGVDAAVSWDDGSSTVVGAIEILKPNFFTKGGDRTGIESVPEYSICDQLGCEIIFNVGGEKIQSSSELVANMRSQNH